ncbi:hypothetical protein BLA60_26595 [Actinophytocola xinjiangensis]|uniref:NACHT domain-containing protein n=1 Tax=Actinophytocola xinjiangensis TaxID=485602 RepID=A0A7Z0WHY9_9PSEU|nr:NACHT domain-containing protein [Actinophytocola xinjiangensis]OLF07500.1 hypothetical protein BLA60_26595 [Actinophytocola xinjiangensis]
MEQDRDRIGNDISGTIHGAAVQAGYIHGGVHIHLTSDADKDIESVGPPSGWAELPTLPATVRQLLRAQVQAAQEMPYRLPGARRPSLATVFVRQHLGTGAEELATEQLRPAPIVDHQGQLIDPPSGPALHAAVRPPARTVREALDCDDNVLVTGGPGQGKSTLSLRLAADVAQRWLAPSNAAEPVAEPVVPLRLTARELASRLDVPFPEAVAAGARAEYGALLGSPLDERVLGERVAGCRWLLLVDGLDEVADTADRDRLVTVLAAWSADDSAPCRVVLTTRPIEGAALAPLQRAGTARYELQPFDEEALQRFAENWFGDASHGYRFIRQIRDAHLDELVRVPLLATIAAVIHEQHRDRPLPDNQFELYESYLKYLRSAHAVASSQFDPVRDQLLEHLGGVRLNLDTSLVAAAREWAQRHIPALAGDWRDELVTFLTQIGPLARRGDDLGFLHHSFAEHLAATAEARLLPECFEPGSAEFSRLLHTARSDERGRHARAVLLHHNRLHPTEADRLVRWLHAGGSEQHLLAARLLAWHVPASAEVVDAFLETVRGWAMTTHYPGHEILGQASRAAHHPGIVDWLTTLMDDENVPWGSRVEAASALSTRLRGAGAAQATDLLRAVAMGERSVPVAQRLAAAEALAECGARERKASDLGLRAVLADPAASAWDQRSAAVVLATFDAGARQHAAEALNLKLDDPWTPDYDRVELATGLLEMGVEFHDRCAEVFRAILDNRMDFDANLGRVAAGLASLGPHHLSHAVSTLTRLITDRRGHILDRHRLAETLATLGPRHRVTAGELLRSMATEIDLAAGDRWRIAQALGSVGLRDEAATLLLAVFADSAARPNDHLWAARTLADLGPDYRDDAVSGFERVVDWALADHYDRMAALGQLANADEPHRTRAVASLRATLIDRGASPEVRRQAANELVRLGPEFHSEVAEHILQIAHHQPDPTDRLKAWRTLRALGTSYRERAVAAVLSLSGPEGVAPWESHRTSWNLSVGDLDDESAGRILTAVLDDVTRSGETRFGAVRTLVLLGRRHHPVAIDGLIRLLSSRAFPAAKVAGWAWTFGRLGKAPRTLLAETLRELVRAPDTTDITVCHISTTMDRLDHRADPEVVTALREIVADGTASAVDRGEAALVLARAVPDELPEVLHAVLRNEDKAPWRWESQVRAAALLGADVVPELRRLLGDDDAERRVREGAAAILAVLRPDLRDEALDELRVQASDECLEFYWRTDAVMRLAEFDPGERWKAVAFHRDVLRNECQPARDRSEAAYQLVQLDPSAGDEAVAALRRFATSQEFTADDHQHAIGWFALATPHRRDELSRMALAAIRDPTMSTRARSELIPHLTGRTRLDAERSMLADRTATPQERVGALNQWQDGALAGEAAAVLKDIIDAPDTLPVEKVAASAALATLSPTNAPVVAALLDEQNRGQCAAPKARTALAALGRTWRRQVLNGLERDRLDNGRSQRERMEAAWEIWTLSSDPAPDVVEQLRERAADPRSADETELTIHYALRGRDGLRRIRQLRDDESVRPATRWSAATLLRDHSRADREAGVPVLEALATDPCGLPPMRWRAARDLARFGERGRERAVAALRAIATDETLPLIVRNNAADVLANVRPDLRPELLDILRALREVATPLALVQALKTWGALEPTEAARALGELAENRSQPAGVRLRAAMAMFQTRADYRDRAAVVARDVAHDSTVPWHIRAKAARTLARWSEPCRAEALALLRELQ